MSARSGAKRSAEEPLDEDSAAGKKRQRIKRSTPPALETVEATKIKARGGRRKRKINPRTAPDADAEIEETAPASPEEVPAQETEESSLPQQNITEDVEMKDAAAKKEEEIPSQIDAKKEPEVAPPAQETVRSAATPTSIHSMSDGSAENSSAVPAQTTTVDAPVRPQARLDTARIRPPPGPSRSHIPKQTRMLTYREGQPLSESAINSSAKVCISSKFIHIANKNVIRRQLWGDGVYTDDSDLVAILIHSGYISIAPFPPDYAGLSVTLRFSKALSNYSSSVRNGMRSRWWGAYEGSSLSIERVAVMEVQEGKTSPQESRILLQAEHGQDLMSSQDWRKVQGGRGSVHLNAAQVASLTCETLQPPLYDTILRFGLSNDITCRYNLSMVADRDLQKAKWTSSRLRNEDLILESNKARFKICWCPTATLDRGEPRYCLAEVLNPRATPLSAADPKTRQIAEDLAWNELKFGPRSVNIRGIHYDIYTAFWSKRPPIADCE